MKKYFVILISMFSVQSFALTWKVVGPCSKTPLYEGIFEADLNKSVGQISQELFDANKVPYVGMAGGFNSINNSPTGFEAIELVSENELRFYGWCYSVNGEVPSVMPSQIKPASQNDVLVWYYGYSTNKNRQWSSDYCAPGYQVKAEQFCGN